MPNFIPMSRLFILTAYIRVPSLTSSMYIRWLIFSCDLLSLYTAVHFLSTWLSGIITILNDNGDSASPLKICHWIFSSGKLLLFAVNSTLQVLMVFSIKCMTSSNILYVLKQFIIQLCRTISFAFLQSIHAIARFFLLVLLSFRMCWSMLSNSNVPLDPFRHPFYFSGNNPWLVSE